MRQRVQADPVPAWWLERAGPLYQFKCGVDGAYPLSSLIFDSAVNLYGTTLQGAAFAMPAAAMAVHCLSAVTSSRLTERVIYSFTGHATDTSLPLDSSLRCRQKRLREREYGARHLLIPPTIGCGVVYELSPTSGGSWTETTLHTFTGAFPNGSLPDGAFPIATLIFDQAGNLYGTTTEGGTGSCVDKWGNPGCGTVFQLSPASGGWTENVLANFTNSSYPTGLTMDSRRETSPRSGSRW